MLFLSTPRGDGLSEKALRLGPTRQRLRGDEEAAGHLEEHFKKLGATSSARNSPPSNVVAGTGGTWLTWWSRDPKRQTRRALHALRHPAIADQEPDRRKWTEPFVSANDGTSGVAIADEFAHHIKTLKLNVGVDFAIFDGEEYIFDNRPARISTSSFRPFRE